MRIYKFRGFHADGDGKTVIKLDGKEIKGIWFYGDLSTDGGYYINDHAVIPETVGQYTGLTDKNGNKIFESDIVSGYFDHEKITGYIFYGSNAKFFIYRKGLYGIELNNASVWINIIGNIFENPELLEVEE